MKTAIVFINCLTFFVIFSLTATAVTRVEFPQVGVALNQRLPFSTSSARPLAEESPQGLRRYRTYLNPVSPLFRRDIEDSFSEETSNCRINIAAENLIGPATQHNILPQPGPEVYLSSRATGSSSEFDVTLDIPFINLALNQIVYLNSYTIKLDTIGMEIQCQRRSRAFMHMNAHPFSIVNLEELSELLSGYFSLVEVLPSSDFQERRDAGI